MVKNPDPEGVRAKIIEERIKMALAMMRRKAEVAWANGSPNVHITNQVLLDEVQKFIEKDGGK